MTPASALGGETAPAAYQFTAKLDIGGERSCTAALIEQQWLLTASSCFAENPALGYNVAAGAPKFKTTATIGRTDLTRDDGVVTDVVQLVPRNDRDLVLAKLAKPVPGVAPASIAATAPVQGEELQVAGYGRTKGEWVPDRLHSAAFTVGTVQDTSMGLAGKTADAVICKGDTGGPALRSVGGRYEIVGVNSRSWQGGCLGTDPSEARKGAVDTRVDDISSWIAGRLLIGQDLIGAGDYNGDGVADLFTTDSSHELSVWTGKKGAAFNGPRVLTGDWNFAETVSADFTGDGVADLVARDAKGNLYLWTGSKNGTFSRPKLLTDGWNFTQTTAGDFTGDGKTDLIARDANADLFLWVGNGDGTFARSRKLTGDWNYTQTVAADFTGDGVADLIARDTKGNLYLWTGSKNGTFSRPKLLTDGWNFTQTTAGDFTGDGKTDLIAKDETGAVYMWLWTGDGNGGFSRPTKIADGS
ncbi:FG-GAP-like repeat-containing protein [Streptomyces sp. NPDC001262]|uniref:FG-GAP-like repeat-containing protein n=1 Tax=Streptomyces sp. NPDC001262 TaxID=3364552 RepID=UPI0036831D1A